MTSRISANPGGAPAPLGLRADACCYEGKNVVDWVRKNQPSLILLDLMLPDIDGYTICETLKLDRETNLIPVIMVTARTDRKTSARPASRRQPLSHQAVHRRRLNQAIQDAFNWLDDLKRSGTEGEIRFHLQSDTHYLEELNHLLGSLFLFSGLTQQQVKQLTTAVRELGTNAIEWGHRKQAERIVTVDYRIDPEKITIDIKDTGPGFDPQQPAARRQARRPVGHMMVRETLGLREGGFGILMSRGLVDEMTLQRKGQRSPPGQVLSRRATTCNPDEARSLAIARIDGNAAYA